MKILISDYTLDTIAGSLTLYIDQSVPDIKIESLLLITRMTNTPEILWNFATSPRDFEIIGNTIYFPWIMNLLPGDNLQIYYDYDVLDGYYFENNRNLNTIKDNTTGITASIQGVIDNTTTSNTLLTSVRNNTIGITASIQNVTNNTATSNNLLTLINTAVATSNANEATMKQLLTTIADLSDSIYNMAERLRVLDAVRDTAQAIRVNPIGGSITTLTSLTSYIAEASSSSTSAGFLRVGSISSQHNAAAQININNIIP